MNRFAFVTKSDRWIVSTTRPRPSSTKTTARMLAFDQALALFGNTCDMRSSSPWGYLAAPARDLGRANAKQLTLSRFRRDESLVKNFSSTILCCRTADDNADSFSRHCYLRLLLPVAAWRLNSTRRGLRSILLVVARRLFPRISAVMDVFLEPLHL